MIPLCSQWFIEKRGPRGSLKNLFRVIVQENLSSMNKEESKRRFYTHGKVCHATLFLIVYYFTVSHCLREILARYFSCM